MFAVVDHEQEVAGTQGCEERVLGGLAATVLRTQRVDRRGHDGVWIADHGELTDRGAVGEVLAHVRCGLLREAGLPDATGSGQGDQSCHSEQLPEALALVVPTDQQGVGRVMIRRRRPPGLRDRLRLGGSGHGGRCGRPQVRVLLEDLLVEGLQVLGWVDPDLLAQPVLQASVGGEGFGLVATSVEREHQLAAGSFVQRVAGHDSLELPDDLAMLTEAELCVDAVGDRCCPEVFEAVRLLADQLVGGEFPEGGAVPEGFGFLQDVHELGRFGRLRPLCSPQERFERIGVAFVIRHAVPTGERYDGICRFGIQ